MCRLFFIAATLIGAVFSFSPLRKSYDHALFMDESEKYELLWSVDRLAATVSFAAVVNTTGWVGFGIAKGQAGTMANADIAIGFVSDDGKGHLVDRYATSNSLPLRDDEQNYVLTGFHEKNGQTILKFNRSIQSCDEKDNNIQVGTARLLFAYHGTDPNPSDDSSLVYHGATQRGSRSVNLLNYVKHEAEVPTGRYVDVVNRNVKVPKKDTTYWCSTTKVLRSKLGGKRHIIEMAPVITPGNEGLVHHVVVYACSEGLLNDTHLNMSFECENPNMPPQMSRCRGGSMLYVWAIGGENFMLPDKVGMPIGTSEEAYYLIETHYDNPEEKEGKIDSSGIRFYYTDKLRKYDGATFSSGVGTNHYFLVPPGQAGWESVGYCAPACSKRIAASSTGKLNVFAAFPHMHTAGAAQWTELVRNGTEIAEIIRDDNYDFNYQQTHILPKEIEILPGDSLITHCKYNTMGRTMPTLGGESSKQEMCLTFLLYYPAINLNFCTSLSREVGANFSAKYAQTEKSGFKSKYNWTNVDWTEAMTDEVKALLKSPYTTSTCSFVGTPDRPGFDAQYVRKPTIDVPLPAKPDRCQLASTPNPTTIKGARTRPNTGSDASRALPYSIFIVTLVIFALRTTKL